MSSQKFAIPDLQAGRVRSNGSHAKCQALAGRIRYPQHNSPAVHVSGPIVKGISVDQRAAVDCHANEVDVPFGLDGFRAPHPFAVRRNVQNERGCKGCQEHEYNRTWASR